MPSPEGESNVGQDNRSVRTFDPVEADQSGIIEENIQETLPSMVFINDRIFEYGRKLERWKELDSQSAKKDVKDDEAAEMVRCFRKLQTVLNGYTNLRSKLLQTQSTSTAERIGSAGVMELEKNDLSFTESSCGQMLTDSSGKTAGWSQREPSADLSQVETLIDRYSENHEYQEVVKVWQQIPSGQLDRVHLRSKTNYGNALMYLHQEEKAAEIYQQVVDQMSSSDVQATDIVSLRKRLADLYTASGNYKAAVMQYKRISDDYQNIGRLEEWSKLQLSLLEGSKDSGPELKEYSAILRDYLGYVAEQGGYKLLSQADNFLAKYPYSPVVANVEVIKAKVKTAADKWYNGFIAQVEKLKSEKKFDEAQELLKTLPPDMISPEQQLSLKGKKEELSMTDAVENETKRMALIQELQNKYNSGMVLAKAEKYDEAIAVFNKLQNTEYAAKAQEKIKEMSVEAAKSDRKKAANLFTRFTKTTDIESRKRLLIETHKLLKSILVKYPDVDIKAKVASNIERVEQEMMAIDPKLLMLAEKDGILPPAKIDGLDRAFATPGVVGQEGQNDPESPTSSASH